MSDTPWRQSLNSSQIKAVEWPPDSSLQILAGPGSGKTRVLTCRVAHLLKHHAIPPENLVVVTFTNKAARELKDRVTTLVGYPLANRIVLGTFHGMCAGFLRKYGIKVGLKPNWSICDRDDQLSYCKDIIKESGFNAQIRAQNLTIKPDVLVDFISKQKSQGMDHKDAHNQATTPYHHLMARMFQAYQRVLSLNNCLDFDDLLGYGERLFRSHPKVISNIEYVLIDEFQDTNTTQYNLMVLLAHTGAVTTVGDPDQGIYGWRNAQSTNLKKMQKDIQNTHVIFLEENYRSSSAILKASLAVVRQDRERVDKSLHTAHPHVAWPVLRAFKKPEEEGAFIAQEILRLIAHTGGQLNYDDFSVLLRYNALSRNIEASLQAVGIPSRMVGGKKFFERVEVKDILAYLQLVDNPSFTPAFERIINVPKRNIGVTTIKAIKAASVEKQMSPVELLVQAIRGKPYSGFKPANINGFKKFLAVICHLQAKSRDGSSVVEIIDALIDSVDYMGHLEKQYGTDAVHRKENVQELKTFAAHLAGESAEPTELPLSYEEQLCSQPEALSQRQPLTCSESGLNTLMKTIRGDNNPSSTEKNSLRHFLEESSLSGDTETEDSKADKSLPKVTISTCHASKGLEWPVVFVTAVEDGIIPFYRCEKPEEIQEERRLLFVAMTRAQGLLYLSHCRERMRGAEIHSQHISSFIFKMSAAPDNATREDTIFSQSLPKLDDKTRKELSIVISRPTPDRQSVANAVVAYQKTTRGGQFTAYERSSRSWDSNYSSSGYKHDSASARTSSSSTSGSNRGYGSFQPASYASQSSQAHPAGKARIKTEFPSSSLKSTQSTYYPQRPPSSSYSKVPTSGLHRPFVPPVARKPDTKNIKTGQLSARLTTAGFEELSADFMSDLKKQIPEDLKICSPGDQVDPDIVIVSGSNGPFPAAGKSSDDRKLGLGKGALKDLPGKLMSKLKRDLSEDSTLNPNSSDESSDIVIVSRSNDSIKKMTRSQGNKRSRLNG